MQKGRRQLEKARGARILPVFALAQATLRARWDSGKIRSLRRFK